ncbi:UPF0175 family protein [Anaerolineales bacterium HSG24]|nr:UPF0175 family protein [Anaerolineales bacterium HSG24]
MNVIQVNFELPVFLIHQIGLDTKTINDEVKRMFALFLYEHQYISLGKACELSGFSLWEFTEMNQQLNIEIAYTDDDLQDDLTRLVDV